ncbi:quinon protein alcohol dehydrogenase-like superfamily [Lentinula edodes]|nr:quinon protein alcohol dehydrogenase-like superfamily [Lentinula edodes]
MPTILFSGNTFSIRHNNPATSVAFSPDGVRIAAGTQSGATLLWDVSGLHRSTFEDYGCTWSVAFSPDGTRIATGHENGKIHVRSAGSGQRIGNPLAHEAPVSTVVFTHDSKLMISGSSNKVYIWDSITGERKSQRHQSGLVLSVAISPDRLHMASTSNDKTIHIWNILIPEYSEILVGHMGVVNCIQYSLNGDLIVSGSDDKTIRIWDAANKDSVKVIYTITHPVWTLALSLETPHLAFGSNTGEIQVWDLDKRELQARIQVGSSINSIAFQPNGQQIVSCSGDGNVQAWTMTNNYLSYSEHM